MTDLKGNRKVDACIQKNTTTIGTDLDTAVEANMGELCERHKKLESGEGDLGASKVQAAQQQEGGECKSIVVIDEVTISNAQPRECTQILDA